MKNYTKKVVYMGIDVHKKTYAVTGICNGEIVKRDTLAAYPKVLIRYIKKYFDGAKVYTAYEAGFSGFPLHRSLVSNGIENIVVHPASIEVSARDRVKTDKRDSLKIAKQLSDGDLRGIKVPSQKREDFRTVTRTRDRLMEERKRIGNQLKSLLFSYGLIKPDDDRKVSRTWIKETKEQEVSEEVKYCIELYAGLWLDFDNKLKEIDKKLAEQAKEDAAVDKLYRAAPGLGALSARILANELGDMSHFSNEGRLFSYTGLTPSEYSSGEHRWLGHISRQGKPILRKILVQAAWRAIKLDRRMAEIFEGISNRAGRKKAIVAVARKLIGCIRSTFISGKLYEIGWSANAPVSQEDL